MTDVRKFIRNLGENAPAFFDVKQATVDRWLKTGSVPIKAVQKILAAVEAAKMAVESVEPQEPLPQPEALPSVDPLTNLPKDIGRRLPDVQVQGPPPSEIEINPYEQSHGNNFTRPGRMPLTARPLPPMKIKKVDGQDVAYVDTEPKTPLVMPPEIAGNAGWSQPYEPKPTETKTERVS